METALARGTFSRSAATLCLAASTSLASGGCGIIHPDDGAQEARVEISGDNSASLNLITSLDFTIFIQPESNQQSVDLNSSDTTSLTALPFDRTYDISSNDRFFARVSNADTVNTANVSMKVTVDGRVLYNSSGDIGGTTLLEFLYRLGES